MFGFPRMLFCRSKEYRLQQEKLLKEFWFSIQKEEEYLRSSSSDRQGKADILRKQTQGDILWTRRQSQGVLLRRPSQSITSQKQSKGDILKRSNKKHSVANAVAVIGVTEALIVGM